MCVPQPDRFLIKVRRACQAHCRWRRSSLVLACAAWLVLAALVAFGIGSEGSGQGAAGNAASVVTVSAASYDPKGNLAPDSIAAAFGSQLATRTEAAPTQPLPTELAGTTLEVNG